MSHAYAQKADTNNTAHSHSPSFVNRRDSRYFNWKYREW